MLNFGGYRGDAILGQALQNAAGTMERRHQMAQEQKYKDAYLNMQEQYADQAKANAEFQNYFNSEKMKEMKMGQLDASFARQAFAAYELQENPIEHSTRFFGSDFEAKESTANKYITPDTKNALRQAYQQTMQEQGYEYDPTRFDRIFTATLGRQAQQVSSFINEAAMMENSPDDINKAMHKSGAGSVIQQALLAGADPASISPMFQPAGGDNGVSWGDVGMTALGVPPFLGKAGLAIGAGKAAYAAGSAAKTGGFTAGAKAAGGVYSGQSFKTSAQAIIKQATTKTGQAALKKKIAAKAGMQYAEKMIAKLALKSAGAGAVNAIPIAGQAVSIGLGLWTLYDLYELVNLLGED